MTKTFADQAQKYFEQYRNILQEIREIDESFAQLTRRHQDLSLQRIHMSNIIVNHIDTGDDIMKCALQAESRGSDDDGTHSNGLLAKKSYCIPGSNGASMKLSSPPLSSTANTGGGGMGTIDISYGQGLTTYNTIYKNTP
jgi:hypothetical protein